MKIVIKTKNIELTKVLKNFIEEKINSLEKFSKIPPLFPQKKLEILDKSKTGKKYIDTFSKISYKKGAGPKVEAWVEVGKESRHHKKGDIFRAECQMRFPGKSLRSTAQREDLKLAITEVKDELQRQLKQSKEKIMAKAKRGARIFKKDLKISPRARFYRKGRIREEGI